jgi:hypothetical protein
MNNLAVVRYGFRVMGYEIWDLRFEMEMWGARGRKPIMNDPGLGSHPNTLDGSFHPP